MNFEVVSRNPARDFEELGRVRCSHKLEIREAVGAAKQALQGWRRTPVQVRCEYVDRFRELVAERADELAELQSKEMGKPIEESNQELQSSIRFLQNQIEKAAILLARRNLDSYSTHRTIAHYQPFGVAAVIIPWNFPTGQFVANSSQTLIAGNTVVLKHSEECVLTSRLLASLIEQTEFPAGVFQVLYGGAEVGQALVEQDVDFIHFTGSSAVGKRIYKQAAEKFIPVTLEMGGSSPAIVTEGVDVQDAARSIFHERFKNCGQICCALKRLYVQDSIFDAIVEQLCALARQQVLGDPLNPNTTMGPLVAARQVETLEDQLFRAVQQGAKVRIGGNRPQNLSGAFFEPTVVCETGPNSPLVQEEVFGPILPAVAFEDVDHAIELANDSPYGLSAFVYCDDDSLADRIVSEIEAGQISVNGASYFSNHAPFGGFKQSGIGRARGDEGYYDATQIKVVGRPPN